jgi:hypothetical protein
MKTLITKILRFKMRQKNKIFISLILLLTGVFCVSCEEDETDPIALSRLFRPINFTQNVDGVTVDLSWTPIASATYLLEISRDSLVFGIDLKNITLPEKTSSYRLEDLWGSTRYSARIKSVSSDPVTADSEYKTLTFVTQSENIFYPVDALDIGIDYITVKWDNTKLVDRILVILSGVETINVVLTEADILIGQKQISGLQPGSKYQFSIYQGERLRGSVGAETRTD